MLSSMVSRQLRGQVGFIFVITNVCRVSSLPLLVVAYVVEILIYCLCVSSVAAFVQLIILRNFKHEMDNTHLSSVKKQLYDHLSQVRDNSPKNNSKDSLLGK
jgi:hypothetical protein